MRVIASFDDGTVEDLQVAEVMRKYEIDTIFYFPVKAYEVNEPHLRTSLNMKQRQDIAKYHEIGSHTLTHPLLTRIDPTTAREEIFKSRELLQKEFSQPIEAFCYPRGYANPELQQMVEEAGYTHARGVNVGYLHQSENPFYEQTTVHVGNDRKEYAGRDWFDYAIKMLQNPGGTTYHLWGHSWELTNYPNGLMLLDKLCKSLTNVRKEGN